VPEIPATQEAEIQRFKVPGEPGKKFMRPPSHDRLGFAHLSSQLLQEG
jgi:hypothetical protein